MSEQQFEISKKFSKVSRDRLLTCAPELQKLFSVVVERFDCTIVQGRRSKEEQNKYFKEGKSKVVWPNSKHNVINPTDLSRAVDAAPFIDGNISWETKQSYYFAGYVMRVADELGINIRWGGSWDMDRDVNDQKFNDVCHFELK